MAWDFKSSYQNNKTIENFGNWHFGSVSAGIGLPFRVAVSGAGVVGRGQGIPFLVYPYGDDAPDVVWIRRGYEFARWYECARDAP
jgi:hypothetical protein